jgi:ATP-dependent DNA helicase RecQ
MENIYPTLQKYFGYSTFRPLQKEIVGDILQQRDVFVLMPTGGGKSLCYQLPSLAMNGTTIVVSPLISLMKDQVDGLVENGVRAAYLNSSLDVSEQQDVLERLKKQQLSLLYVAPERLVQESFLRVLKTIAINFFAIDEAHCISQWGHDFRPEYRQLALLREQFPDKAVVALTATATPRVKEDIVQQLGLSEAKVYQASFNRPNLTYRVVTKQHPFDQLLSYVQQRKDDSGIVYCLSRKTVERVAKDLQDAGIEALPYHAGLNDTQRKKNQERFIRDDVQVVVATIAFGMGIDKPNVRYVVHYDLPKSLEHYYQETGRAGRDGLPSECVFLFRFGDKFAQERFIQLKTDAEEQKIARIQLQRVIDFAQHTSCRRKALLQYFAEDFDKENCASCDNCVTKRETFDGTEIAQKILSCVYRVGERFGITHVIGVLTGSEAERILEMGHNKLSTFGIVKEYAKEDLKLFMYELVQFGYLTQSADQYGILKLGTKSKAVLQGKEKVFLTKLPERIVKVAKTGKVVVKDMELFNRLRALRKRLADEAHVPPYVVFSDASLREMASSLPKTKTEFAKIKGVGQKKLETYAEVFLKEIHL